MTKLRVAELINTSAWPPAALEAEFWTFRKNDFVHFQDLLLLFKLCSLFCTITTGHWAPEAAVHRHHRLQVQHGAEAKSHQGCDSLSAILRQNGQTTAIFEEAAACFAFPNALVSRQSKKEEVVAVAAAAAAWIPSLCLEERVAARELHFMCNVTA